MAGLLSLDGETDETYESARRSTRRIHFNPAGGGRARNLAEAPIARLGETVGYVEALFDHLFSVLPFDSTFGRLVVVCIGFSSILRHFGCLFLIVPFRRIGGEIL